MNRFLRVVTMAIVAASCVSLPARADGYYLPRGHEVRVIPEAAVTVQYGHDPYYFHEGVWYRPHGHRYVVVAPPFGVFVPVLPPFYTTLWFGGVPYYYANDVYYVHQGDGYVVTAPPEHASPPPQTPASDQPFIYPKNAQSEQQQATDRYECHSWAAKEAQFDPTLPGNVAQNEVMAKRANYFRAMSACLEGRGYTVR